MDGAINGISVILCCYNSANRLPKTLLHLARQQFQENLNWELILVNNNSTDDTEKIAEAEWEKLGAPTVMSVIDQPIAGLSFAREKGISVSRYDLILFCDDDNWLRADYLQNAFDIFIKNPEIGALGGWSEAVFESEKPDWFDKFSGNFAVGKPIEEMGIINTPEGFLYGAGMIIHKDTFSLLKENGFSSILSDRKGELLSSGGDVELVYAMKILKVPIMFSDLLFFNHFMPAGRLEWDYLIKLRKSMYWSNFVLNIYIDTLKNRPLNNIWLLKKVIRSIQFIYNQKKKIVEMDPHKRLFLENQIAIRRLFIRNISFYYKTRVALKQLNYA